MTRVHEVRSWSHLFDAVAAGRKTHDLRIDDRGYEVGDVLRLRRYDQMRGEETGETVDARITYITGRDAVPCAVSTVVLPREYVILSIQKMTDGEAVGTFDPFTGEPREVTGNFAGALESMLRRLSALAVHDTKIGDVLRGWDGDRGTDWFTGTLSGRKSGR